MTDFRACIYCGDMFAPNKYSPKQTTCSKPDCQKKRQIESMKQWRQSHPNYFKFDETKSPEWIQKQRDRSKQWRQNNPEKVKAYRQGHLDEYRRYMRDYMRQYRQSKRIEQGAAEATRITSSSQAPSTENPNQESFEP